MNYALQICYAGEEVNMEISAPMVFEQYVVISDYQKKNKNDISLTAGDIIDVIERNDYGEKRKKKWFTVCVIWRTSPFRRTTG